MRLKEREALALRKNKDILSSETKNDVEMEMYADNGIMYRKLSENTLDELIFLDNELGNKINSLKRSMEFESCEYLEHAEKGGRVLTSSAEGLVKTGGESVSLFDHLHLCSVF